MDQPGSVFFLCGAKQRLTCNVAPSVRSTNTEHLKIQNQEILPTQVEDFRQRMTEEWQRHAQAHSSPYLGEAQPSRDAFETRGSLFQFAGHLRICTKC